MFPSPAQGWPPRTGDTQGAVSHPNGPHHLPPQLDAESEVNNEMANRMSLFYAEATPMLKTLSNATTKFVSEVSEAGGDPRGGVMPPSSPGTMPGSGRGTAAGTCWVSEQNPPH